MKTLFVSTFFIFLLLSYSNNAQDISLEEKEQLFILNNSKTGTDIINLFGNPDEKSKAEKWGADGMEHQMWYYRNIGIDLDLVKVDSKTLEISSITIYEPSDLKTLKGLGIGSSREEVLTAYKTDIRNTENTIFIMGGSDVSGINFNLENGKVKSIFIGAWAE